MAADAASAASDRLRSARRDGILRGAMRHRAHRVFAYRAALLLGLATTTAQGETALDATHAEGFYLVRAGGVVGALGLALATHAFVVPTPPARPMREWLGIDESVRGHLSTSASAASDFTLLAAMGLPLVAELEGFSEARWGNTSIVYTEVLATNLLLNTVVKRTVPRLRPYTYGVPPRTAHIESQQIDAHLSFYSGHASTAFAAAASGSYLFGASHPNDTATRFIFGAQATLAAVTAGLRVRAGKHYYSDVTVGVVVGSAIGIALPVIEGVRYRPSAVDLGFAGGGLVVGTAAAALLPFAEDALPPEMPPDLPKPQVHLLPLLGQGAVGISAVGVF